MFGFLWGGCRAPWVRGSRGVLGIYRGFYGGFEGFQGLLVGSV